jgi:serine/threonine protein kinase
VRREDNQPDSGHTKVVLPERNQVSRTISSSPFLHVAEDVTISTFTYNSNTVQVASISVAARAYSKGEELRQQLNDGPLPSRKAIDYAQQIASGLAAAHSKSIVHRDLKPENIFITTDGRVKILDFGLAKLRPQQSLPDSGVATQRAITDPGVALGTVGYMSPEQVRGQVADHRSDIFSFGVILYEMLTGRQAFLRETTAETMTAILKEEPEELTELNNKVPIDPWDGFRIWDHCDY